MASILSRWGWVNFVQIFFKQNHHELQLLLSSTGFDLSMFESAQTWHGKISRPLHHFHFNLTHINSRHINKNYQSCSALSLSGWNPPASGWLFLMKGSQCREHCVSITSLMWLHESVSICFSWYLGVMGVIIWVWARKFKQRIYSFWCLSKATPAFDFPSQTQRDTFFDPIDLLHTAPLHSDVNMLLLMPNRSHPEAMY